MFAFATIDDAEGYTLTEVKLWTVVGCIARARCCHVVLTVLQLHGGYYFTHTTTTSFHVCSLRDATSHHIVWAFIFNQFFAAVLVSL